MRTSKLVGTHEFDGIFIQSHESREELRFRLEIFCVQEGRQRTYTGKVWRRDSYKVRPSFGKDGDPHSRADCEFLVVDDFYSGREFVGKTSAEVLRKFSMSLRETFTPSEAHG